MRSTVNTPTIALWLSAFVAIAPWSSARAESSCARMLEGAPPQVLQLEAVRSCTGKGSACAYVEPTPDFGVLTMFCPGVAQILFANRLSSLQSRDGVLRGECTSGSWGADFGLPGCYPTQWHPRLPAASE